MKFIRRTAPERFALPVVPLLAVAFQLLILLLLNLRMFARESDLDAHLPIAGPAEAAAARSLADIKVGLRSDAEGNLTQLTVGHQSLGNDDAAFDRLSNEILKIIVRPGNPLTKDIEVEIDADYELHYKYVIRAVSRCTGRLDPQTNQLVRYVEKIKFAPPKQPRTAA